MRVGDIVLVSFPFTNLTTSKNRPAVILINSDTDVVVAFLTTQLKWRGKFDVPLEPDATNGLKKPSIIRLDKITTIEKELIIGKLGSVSSKEKEIIVENLISLLKEE